jgi:hypothetical protein
MTVSGDFNGDGIPDLAIYDGAILSYYQGKGDGSFAIPNGGANSLILDAQFSLLITGDFNGDGILDAAAVEEPIGTTNDYLFEVLLGDKSHSTGFQFDANDSNVLMPDQNPALVAADFTSDGIPDLLAFVAGGYVPAGTPPSTYVGGYSSISRSTSQPTSLQGTGIHTVIANYPGDSNHDGSVSAPISLDGVQSVNYSNGFTSAAGLTLNGGATVTGGAIQLTDGGQFESRGAFTTNRVPVYYFNTTFDFQITNAEADGFAFVVQSNGPNAVGASGGGIGYGQPPGATSGASIVNSFALVFDLHNNQGEGNNSIRTEVGGVTSGTGTTGATDLTPYGLDLHSGHRFRAALLGYASGGSILTLTDLDTSKSYTTQLGDDQFKALGDTVGYVGFTAGTGEQTESVRILDWSYVGQACCLSIPLTPQVPAYGEGFPAGASLMALNGGATIAGGALQLTNGTQFEATSAYFIPKVGTGHWTSDFDFSITGTEGDGFTYVLQDQGVAAVGSSGGGLGYGTDGPDVPGRTIGNSLAVKFDLHNNAGEGTNSTGIYFNGASPTVPAVDLSPSRINLHNGHTFHVRLYLDADFNLNMSVTDLTEYAVFNTKFSVEGQSILSNYAFAGFTAGTGMSSNTVKIQNWTWNYYDVDLTP